MPSPRHIAALATAALALLAAGCGEKEKGLLTADQATTLSDKLDEIERSLDNDSCQEAGERAGEGVELASRPRDLDAKLRSNIIEGFNLLVQQGPVECKAAEEPEETATPEETPTEEPTEEPTEVPTEEPTEAPTEEPTEVPTEVPTPEVTLPPAETPPEDTGGANVPDLGDGAGG